MERDELHSISQLIQSRRTIRKILPDSIPRELIYTILEIASFAPFHSKKNLGKFYLFQQNQNANYFQQQSLKVTHV